MNTDHGKDEGFFGSRWNIVWIGFALVAGFFLITEHTAHVFGALPYLLLLACPLMHLFGHHGHHGHGADKSEGGGERKSPDQTEDPPRHSH
jgi:Protein of unknown function (DUF2933)